MEKPNLSYINEIAGDDEAFRAKLIGVIKNELPGEIAEYKQSVTVPDYAQAANHVHKLKHKISVMGMEKSYYLAEDFEKNLKQGNTEKIAEFELVLAAMQDFAASL